jgi:sulfite reductase alpha subunit-like flavoprotein
MNWLVLVLVGGISLLFLFFKLRPKRGGPRYLHVFFGSQTRTTERYANELAEYAKSRNVTCRLQELNTVSLDFLDACGPAVILCSTHGKGEPPENAAKFLKSLEMATKKGSKRLTNLHYSLFGFGSSEYFDTFNKTCTTHTAKAINKCLVALGANAFHKPMFGDETENVPEQFAQWRDAMLSALDTMGGVPTEAAAEQPETRVKFITVETVTVLTPPDLTLTYESAIEKYINGCKY